MIGAAFRIISYFPSSVQAQIKTHNSEARSQETTNCTAKIKARTATTVSYLGHRYVTPNS